MTNLHNDADNEPGHDDDNEAEQLDTLVGAKAIAKYAGIDVRQAFRALELGFLPGTKLGKLWISRKSAIRRRIDGGAL